MMTRQGHKALASSLHQTLAWSRRKYNQRNDLQGFDAYSEGWLVCLEALATGLKMDNPKFDESRFINAVLNGAGG